MALTPIQKKTAPNNNIQQSSCNCEIIFLFNWGLEERRALPGPERSNQAQLCRPAVCFGFDSGTSMCTRVNRSADALTKPLQPHHKTSDVTRSPDIKKHLQHWAKQTASRLLWRRPRWWTGCSTSVRSGTSCSGNAWLSSSEFTSWWWVLMREGC